MSIKVSDIFKSNSGDQTPVDGTETDTLRVSPVDVGNSANLNPASSDLPVVSSSGHVSS
jgi:hypothetical protein